MKKNKKFYQNNYQFLDSSLLNNQTFLDYFNRLKLIALSRFEWVNLPTSMNQIKLEKSLFYFGMAAFLNTQEYGFINTNAASSGYINIYDLPTRLNCYSNAFNSERTVYYSPNPINKKSDLEECILVQNNYDILPTAQSIELFAYRLYEAERSSDVNIKSQKTPVLLLCDEKQRLMMENLYNQYDGNKPVIFGDKLQLDDKTIRSINTQAPFVADKIQDYKKEIWNEALSFLGINNITIKKKERLIQGEANENNELINYYLYTYLYPRQLACKQFNEKYNLTGTDKEISVRLNSDLHNVIKDTLSSVNDYKKEGDINE